MATSGAYSGQSFSFNYSFVDSTTPTSFFTTDLTTSDVTVYSRTGSSTGAGASIASAPSRSGSLFTFTLSSTEMTGDEVIVQVSASGMVPETISIALQPTPSDISEVAQSAVSGVSDFHGSGGSGGSTLTEADIYTYFTSSSRQNAFKATGFSTFDPTSDTVANVTTVGSVSGSVGSVSAAVTTDSASRTASQANVSGLSTFDPSVDTVTTDTASRNASKADVSGLATQASVNTIDSNVDAILVDTNDLQTNQGNWLTATGFSTHSATDVRNALQAVAGDFKATGFSTHAASDVAALVLDTPANKLVTNASGQVEASNMRGTDGAVTTAAPTAADVYTYFTSSSRQDTFKATGFATVNPDNASISAILTDTNDLQTNQGNWLTATGFSTHSASDVVSAMQVVAGDFKADVSGLSTFDSTSDTVTVGTNNDKTGYVLTQSFPSNFSSLIIGTGSDAGKVTTSNPAAGSGSAHTAADVAALILDTPANKLVTNASGQVESSNMRGTDNAATSSQVSALNDFDPATDTVANVTTVGSVTGAVTTDTASRNASKADVSGLSTFDPATDEVTTDAASRTASQANVASLATQSSVNTVDTVVDAIKAKTDQLAFTVSGQVDANALTGGGGDDAATIYTYFTAGSREDAFKATGFATVNPDNASITAILADTNELQTNQGDWLTATGFSTHSATDVRNALQAVAGDFKADTSGLSTFDATTDTVTTDTASRNASKADVSGLSTFDASTDTVTTDSASRTASQANVSSLLTTTAFNAALPSNFDTLIVGTGSDAGKVTTSNPAAGSGSAHTAQDVANLILDTPANKLVTNSSGQVEASNMRGTDNAATSSQVSALNDFDPTSDTVANVTTVGSVTNPVETDTASRNASKADVSGLSTFDASTDTVTTDSASRNASKADVSSLATQSSVNTVDTVVDAIKVKTDQLTFTVSNQVDANALTGGGGGSAPTEADIYTYFTAGAREDAFKADVSSLASQSSVDSIDTDVQNIGSDVTAILTDTNDLQTNQNNWLTATGFSTFDPATDEVTTDAASRNASKADVSGLSTFDPATDTVANVTTVGSVSGAVTTDTASRNASKADVSSLATQASVDTIDSNVDTLLAGAGDVTLTSAQLQAIADEVLSRSVANVESGAAEHTLATIVLSILESQRTATNWTIYRTDGTTPHATKVLTLDGTAQPVTRVQ